MKNFDKTKPSTFIQYLDANNLYGWQRHKNLQLMVSNGLTSTNQR